uniref:MYND-type domain-containing protein n=1 Tax=Mycena chlorophos TaxID=658473 RepID=A0ABQ0L7L5_MYCCL|nr:predicted protein [Mycena chlorophos]
MATLHPALRLSGLQSLPLKIRLDAQAACRIDGPSAKAVSARQAFANLGSRYAPAILPLIFHLLDPKRVPIQALLDDAEPLDAATCNGLSTCIAAMDTLFRMSSIPPGSGEPLWARVYPWFSAIYTHWPEIHRQLGMSERPLVFRLFVCFLGRNSSDGTPAEYILTTPGIAEVLFGIRARHFAEERHRTIRRTLLLDFSNHIMPLVPSDKQILEQMVVGAGGSIEDLAKLIVEHLETVLTDEELDLSDDAFVHLILTALGLILHGDFGTLPGPSKLDEIDWMVLPVGELVDALLDEAGFLEIFMKCIQEVSGTLVADTFSTLADCWLLVHRILISSQGDISPLKIMHAGVLPAFMVTARLDRDPRAATVDLAPRLDRVLQGLELSCLYRSNAHGLSAAMTSAETKYSAQNAAFKRSSTYARWVALQERAHERQTALDHTYARMSGFAAQHKICDNVQCHEMQERRQLKKCTGCEAVSYCSKICQRVDWTSGGHRTACAVYGSLSLTDRSDRFLAYMDRKYLRCLIDEEYYNNFDEISAKQIVFLVNAYSNSSPSEDILPVTIFDHTCGPSRREVHTVEQVSQLLSERVYFKRDSDVVPQQEWSDIVRRARRSGGRMLLHVVRALHLRRERILVLPLWTAEGLVWDRVRSLARVLAEEQNCGEITEDKVLQDRRFRSVQAARVLVEVNKFNMQQIGGIHRLDAAGH